ncbi:hypothetical protein M422DRAFT_239512 [Sphaerobolus stellatus SS14]|nr:hypothetical protein M422DRAFT_239512 [Sphaerobolus stellatus SS14]
MPHSPKPPKAPTRPHRQSNLKERLVGRLLRVNPTPLLQRLSSSASQSSRGEGEEKSTWGKQEFFSSTSSPLLEKETELCESTSVCAQKSTKKARPQQQKANKWRIDSDHDVKAQDLQEHSDDEDGTKIEKVKRGFDESKLLWFRKPDPILDPRIKKTLERKHYYLTDLKQVKQSLLGCADCPPFPDSLWLNVISSKYIDLDKFSVMRTSEHRRIIELDKAIRKQAASFNNCTYSTVLNFNGLVTQYLNTIGLGSSSMLGSASTLSNPNKWRREDNQEKQICHHFNRNQSTKRKNAELVTGDRIDPRWKRPHYTRGFLWSANEIPVSPSASHSEFAKPLPSPPVSELNNPSPYKPFNCTLTCSKSSPPSTPIASKNCSNLTLINHSLALCAEDFGKVSGHS